MTQIEYQQFKAFTRFDGAILGVMLSVTYFFYVQMLTSPSYQYLFLLGLAIAPFFVANRLRNYRDNVVQKRVSYKRALAYSASCFGYAALIVALATFVYLQFFDHGNMMHNITALIGNPEMKQLMAQSGFPAAELDKELEALSQMRPIDFSISMISNIIFAGLFLSLFIALFTRRMPRTISA